jgi:predicted ATPase/class 3 adenylate cyclase
MLGPSGELDERCYRAAWDDAAVIVDQSVPPSGTVTFLFTDIEGSTEFWERHPAAMQVAVESHDRILRSVIESGDGYVFTTAGDSFAAAFPRVGAALEAAVAIQRQLGEQDWPDPVRLSVRVGLHTGEASERDGDYFGPAVNLAARVMSKAHGGQIVVSGSSVGLLGDDFDLRALGSHRVKGVAEPVELAQVLAESLVSEFPDIGGTELLGNLLATGGKGELVGRSTEVAELADHLSDHRLVTLTGVGGVGKTRLALALAESVADRFGHGCWLVDLAPVGDPDEVPNAVMAALELRPQPGLSASEAVADALRDQSRLLVLDNCEHLLAPVADFVDELAGGTTSVRVIATSREPLGVAGEQIFPVPSLVAESAGAELFLARCRAADPSFQVGDAELETVVQLCRRLDGIPLAIELAAARISALSPTELLHRLEDRFRLLRGARRGVVDRHRTLLAAVEWSYRLLNETEQDLFCRLSVFPASFDLEAVGAVCSAELDELDVIDLVEALVGKSLVTSFRDAGATRFRVLETLRQYGETQLDDESAVQLRDRHLAHYLAVAEKARVLFEEADGYTGGDLFNAEWDNIRAAATWAAMASELDDLDLLLTTVGHYAVFSLRLHDLSSTMAEAVERPDCSATILGIAGLTAAMNGDLTEALELTDKALRQSDGSPDFWCLYGAFMANWYSGDIERGWDYVQQGAEVAQASSHRFDLLSALGGRAVAAGTVAAPDLAPSYIEELQALIDELGSVAAAAFGSWVSSRAMSQHGDSARVFADLQRARDLADHPSLRWIQTVTWLSQGLQRLQRLRRTDAEASQALGAAIQQFHLASDWLHVWVTVEAAAIHLKRRDESDTAAVIAGYLDRHERQHSMFVEDRRELSHNSQQSYTTETARGAAMTRDEIIQFTLESLHTPD